MISHTVVPVGIDVEESNPWMDTTTTPFSCGEPHFIMEKPFRGPGDNSISQQETVVPFTCPRKVQTEGIVRIKMRRSLSIEPFKFRIE
jgi:hypothetical protein